MKITQNGPQSIGQIKVYFQHGDLFLSPDEYQRESAWHMSQKQLLIDTIFRHMDIPKFYLWKINQRALAHGYPDGQTKDYYRGILERKRHDNDDDDPYVFEVIDGQQRIRTILEYLGIAPPNERVYRGFWLDPFTAMPDTPMARGRRFSQLNPDQTIQFEQTPLSIVVLEDATIDEIREMFLRLQNGTPLNTQQKRDAMGTTGGRAARDLATLPYFTTSVFFENTNSEHNLVATQMLQLEWNEKIVSCLSSQLDKLYKQFRHTEFETDTAARARRIVTLM